MTSPRKQISIDHVLRHPSLWLACSSLSGDICPVRHVLSKHKPSRVDSCPQPLVLRVAYTYPKGMDGSDTSLGGIVAHTRHCPPHWVPLHGGAEMVPRRTPRAMKMKQAMQTEVLWPAVADAVAAKQLTVPLGQVDWRPCVEKSLRGDQDGHPAAPRRERRAAVLLADRWGRAARQWSTPAGRGTRWAPTESCTSPWTPGHLDKQTHTKYTREARKKKLNYSNRHDNNNYNNNKFPVSRNVWH